MSDIFQVPVTYKNKQYSFIIDKGDYEKISKHKWHLDIDKRYNTFRVKSSVYQGYKKSPKNIKLHRYLMDAKKGEVVDHINHNTLDNRKSNLRITNNYGNGQNRNVQKNNLIGYKGVKKANNKYMARIFHNNIYIYLGVFNTPEDAAKEYNKKAKEIFGEFAYLNEV